MSRNFHICIGPACGGGGGGRFVQIHLQVFPLPLALRAPHTHLPLYSTRRQEMAGELKFISHQPPSQPEVRGERRGAFLSPSTYIPTETDSLSLPPTPQRPRCLGRRMMSGEAAGKHSDSSISSILFLLKKSLGVGWCGVCTVCVGRPSPSCICQDIAPKKRRKTTKVESGAAASAVYTYSREEAPIN